LQSWLDDFRPSPTRLSPCFFGHESYVTFLAPPAFEAIPRRWFFGQKRTFQTDLVVQLATPLAWASDFPIFAFPALPFEGVSFCLGIILLPEPRGPPLPPPLWLVVFSYSHAHSCPPVFCFVGCGVGSQLFPPRLFFFFF